MIIECRSRTAGRQVGAVLQRRGVLGRFGVDFVCVRRPGGWEAVAIEINLRKGGTTHTFQTLQYLTGGHYDPDNGLFRTPTGQARYYYATDNLTKDLYRRLIPEDLIDIAVEHDLHFDQTTQQGVTFNLIGALSEFGKLGVVSIADSPKHASDVYERTVAVLDREASALTTPTSVSPVDHVGRIPHEAQTTDRRVHDAIPVLDRHRCATVRGAGVHAASPYSASAGDVPGNCRGVDH